MSVEENSNVQQLVEIHESLFSLLNRKVNGAISTATSSHLNKAIQSRIRALQASPLYDTSGKTLKKELETLDVNISRLERCLGGDNKKMMETTLN